jgi:hypothetical protein
MSPTLRRTIAATAALLAGTAGAVAIAGPAAAALSGRFVVSASTPSNANDSKTVNALCPAGSDALGGGGLVTGGARVSHLTSSVPMPVGNGHYARANEHGSGGTASWGLTAYSICADGATGIDEVFDFETIPANAVSGAASVSCPAGKRVISMGGDVRNPSGFSGDFILSSTDVDNGMTTVTVWWARAFDTPLSVIGSLDIWARCIDPVTNMQVARATSAHSSADKTVNVSCPTGMDVYGLGGGVLTGAARRAVTIDGIVPALSTGSVVTREKTTYTNNWTAFATAICATSHL